MVSMPAEADEYLTPEERRAVVELIKEQSLSEQQTELEQDENDIQDYEEDCSMDMTL